MEDTAARMAPAFAERLDARVAAGFPRRAPAGGFRAAGRWHPRRLALAGATLALAIAATVLALGAGRHSRQPVGPVAAGSSAAVVQRAAPSSRGAAGTAASAADSAAVLASPSPAVPPGRQVQRAATMSLSVAAGQVPQAADRAIAATERVGGIVQTSTVSTGTPGAGQATFDLLIPSNQLDAALGSLSALGRVDGLTQTTQDITDQVGAAQRRLTEAEAERTALLRQLARATTTNQVTAIHDQLGLVEGRISADQQTLASLRRQSGYAHVQLTISDGRQGAVGGGGQGGGWSLDSALHDAGDVLGAVLGGTVVALAVLGPAAILGLLGWAGASWLRRRRREQALGPV
jgi:hypothetical protein